MKAGMRMRKGECLERLRHVVLEGTDDAVPEEREASFGWTWRAAGLKEGLWEVFGSESRVRLSGGSQRRRGLGLSTREVV